ncbi:SlyX family protein [Chitinophaga sp. G-6-1-13]|uniref:SlyX family protein n=1 Tax=Chitinophaga fulva TaxID=2728842 RepID=A0A848GQH4_9BACT|nr:hypothetical protein [Chitinophaga fulva]NML40217.1 SlyX family protein [Chitinophaga fulva]
MKKLLVACALLSPVALHAQVATLVQPSNISYAGLEKNMLFYANKRFTVTQTGSHQLDASKLFDGRYDPSYTGAPTENDPTVVLIDNIWAVHTQKVAYVGWTTRYWPPTRFKVEGYNISGTAGWQTIADVTGYTNTEYIQTLFGQFSKLRFTFYNGTGPQGQLGISELFFLHGEAVQAYDGLMVRYDENGEVNIGNNQRNSNLNVNGNIKTRKVKVTQQEWADFVFDPTYQLPTLPAVAQFIRDNRHLPDIPSAAEVSKQGVDVGDMSARLLQKIEEMTLYLIEQHKQIDTLTQQNRLMAEKIKQLEQSHTR